MMKASLRSRMKTIPGWGGVLLLVIGLFLAGPAGAKPPYLVMGYLPDYDTGVNASSLSWGDMTHVMEAFAEPNSDGSIYFQSPGQRSGLVSTAHSNSTRVLLTFGGEAGAAASTWESAIGPNLNNFVNNIMNQVNASGYDGVDIDWEFPAAGDKSAFTNFMSALASRLHSTNGYDGRPRQLTFFISPGYYICGVDWANIGRYADYGILSGYAYGCDSFNGPLNDSCGYTDCLGAGRQASVVDSVNRLAGLGFSKSQLVMGIPMYSTQGEAVVNILGGTLTQYFGTQAEATYGGNTGVDNAQSYCDKINWMASQSPKLPGISMWEISQAYPPTNGSVAPLWAAIGARNGCVNYGGGGGGNPPTSTPTPRPVPTNTPGSGGCTSTAITPYLQVNNGSWQQTNVATVASGSTVNLGPQPASGGSWSWSGPNGFSSTSRQINGIPLSSGTNNFTATYTNTGGCKSTETFSITVTGGGNPPTLTPTPPPSGGGGCSGVAAWNGNFVHYAVGAKVTYNGRLYQCIQAHTSQPGWNPAAVPALWQDKGPC